MQTDLFTGQEPARQNKTGYGSVILTQLVNGRKIQKRYTGMSIHEAAQLFKEYIKTIQHVDRNSEAVAAD